MMPATASNATPMGASTPDAPVLARLASPVPDVPDEREADGTPLLEPCAVPTGSRLVIASMVAAGTRPHLFDAGRLAVGAAAVTNAARYTVRPLGPLVAGAVQQIAIGAPLLVAGTVKAGYDLALWRWARHLPIDRPTAETAAPPVPVPDGAETR
jgi:hypothetical protein